MVRLSSIRPFAAAALLLMAACSDGALAPEARSAADASPPREAVLHRGKYRDSSAPHATGRSGSATLAARALLGANGVTTLVVTTGSLDALDAAPGELAKVQLKVIGADGSELFAQNHQRPSRGGSAEFALPGLARGQRIQVQANVRGIDRRRTDVVTITETVRSAPVLQTVITPPAQVVVGVPTVVTAVIRETGGDAGAYTDCVLYVDGVAVDRGTAVWVDAGDEVTCAFTHTFTSGGSHNLEVRLMDGSAPGGFAVGGTSSAVQVSAVVPNPRPSYTASVEDRMVATTTRFDYRWSTPDGSTRVYESSETTGSRSQTVSLGGTLPRATAFPLARVELSLKSDVSPWQESVWDALSPAATGCADRLVAEHGGHFTLCSTGAGLSGTTTFGYTRFAGTVTYHAEGFSRTWDGPLQTDTEWSWNNGYETGNGGGQAKALGSTVLIRLEITDGVGPFSVSAAVPLRGFDEIVSERQRSCVDDAPYWLWGGVRTTCESSVQRATGWAGTVSG